MSKQKYPLNQFYGSEDEKRAFALVTMTYITMSISNAYIEETKEIMEQYGKYHFETKHECEAAIRAFDRYHESMNRFFKGELPAQHQLIVIYEAVKKALDEQVVDSIAQYNRKQEGQE